MLWINAGSRDTPQAPGATTILDEIARLGFEGTQFGIGFPEGQQLRQELASRRLRLAEVYVPVPATVDGPPPDALDAALELLRLLHDAGGGVLCVAIDGSRGSRRDGGPCRPTPDAGLHRRRLDGTGCAAARPRRCRDGPRAPDGVPSPCRHVRRDAGRDRSSPGGNGPSARRDLPRRRPRHRRRPGPGRGDPRTRRAGAGTSISRTSIRSVLDGLRTGTLSGLGDAVRDGLFTELGAGVLDLDGVLVALDRARL